MPGEPKAKKIRTSAPSDEIAITKTPPNSPEPPAQPLAVPARDKPCGCSGTTHNVDTCILHKDMARRYERVQLILKGLTLQYKELKVAKVHLRRANIEYAIMGSGDKPAAIPIFVGTSSVTNKCALCNRDTMNVCGTCQETHYCSDACQESHVDVHESCYSLSKRHINEKRKYAARVVR